MTLTKGRIDRTGAIVFHDASIHIWEEGIGAARAVGGFEGANRWERQFKHDVFARIVQTLNRLGWRCVVPESYIKQYGISFARGYRFCVKGDLKGWLEISGRCIKFEMWQSLNTPNRPDNDGKYEPDKEAVMPYVLRLEMERTRRRIRDYLCNVFTGYVVTPKKISSPNPDPLAYFNDSWDSEYEKSRGIHRFKRDADGWPSIEELSSWNRKDKDGAPLRHGDIRWIRDRKGRLLRGRVYGGINDMWLLVYGPGQRDFTHEHASKFFTYRAGQTPRKLIDNGVRRKRLEAELAKATAAMNFERAATLRDVLFPGAPALFVVWHEEHKAYHCPGFCGYTTDKTMAGKFTADEVRNWNRAPNKVMPLPQMKDAA